MTIGSKNVEEDTSVKQGGDGGSESLADKKAETSGRVGGTDQPMKYIIHFTKVVKLYLSRPNHSLEWTQNHSPGQN